MRQCDKPNLSKSSLATLLCCAVFAFISASINVLYAADGNERDRIEEIKRLIVEIPSWPFLPVVPNERKLKAAHDRAIRIETIAKRVAQYRSKEIRQAVVELEKDGHKESSSERLFIINQFLFAVPEQVTPDSPHEKYIRSGYIALPESAMRSNSWPWEVAEDGRARFSVEAHGIHRMGEPYPASEIFDYYLSTFGMRKERESAGMR